MKINEDNIIKLTVDMCGADTTNPPGNEYLLKDYLVSIFEKMGAKVEVFEKSKGRTNVVGRIKGKKGGKVVAIVGHTDVVPVAHQVWDSDPFVPEVRDGRIIARGAIDDKGPFAATIEAVRVFVEETDLDFAGEILLIAAADEEYGSEYGIKYLFNEIGLKCDYALIPDNGDWDEMTYGEMGIFVVNILSKGTSVHGSVPEKGFNAILPLAILMQSLSEYNWSSVRGDEHFDGCVLNIGKISGGTAPNIVPDKAELKCMWRYPVGVPIDSILGIVNDLVTTIKNKYPQTNIEIEQTAKSIPYMSNPRGKLIELSEMTAKKLSMPIPRATTIRAETVAKYIHSACRAEVIVNGPDMDTINQMHKANESVSIQNLTKFSKFYAHLMYNLLCVER